MLNHRPVISHKRLKDIIIRSKIMPLNHKEMEKNLKCLLEMIRKREKQSIMIAYM
jgi:hypothetical protein